MKSMLLRLSHTRPLCTTTASHNFYKLLGLQETFRVDAEQLSSRFKSLQRQWHPDRFGNAPPSEQRRAASMSANLNEAYATLRVPDRRARHLLQLRDDDATPPKLDPAFLFWVVETREALESAIDAKDSAFLQAQKVDIEREVTEYLSAIDCAFETGDMHSAATKTSQLQYLRRMQTTIEDYLH